MGSKQIFKERMAPGSSSMLRSRRRDVNIKPNRVLDRNSSRGMIYENEELRLRTININAEVERGQNDIKKLRRENDQLRREIWTLREEYDRLEALLKSKELASEDAEESEDEDSLDKSEESDQEKETDQQKAGKDVDMLSVVEEEPEENATEGDQKNQRSPLHDQSLMSYFGQEGLPPPLIPPPFLHSTNLEENPLSSGEGSNAFPNASFPVHDSTYCNINNSRFVPQDLDQFLQNCDSVPQGSTIMGGNQPPLMTTVGEIHSPPAASQIPQTITSHQGLNPSVTSAGAIGNQSNAQEVIDSLSEQLPEYLLSSLKGIRLVGGACYLSLGSDEDVKSLMNLPLKIRNSPLQLEDASVGAVFIALSGVPHDVSDEAVANTLAHFGSVIGGVERRLYKGVDTGERLTRLRPKLAIPRTMWIGGCRISLRELRPDEISALSIARRKSFRSQLHVRLRPLNEDGISNPPIPPATTAETSVTQSVPDLSPLIQNAGPPIGFSCTQSVPDLTIRPHPPEPPPKPKPQFFSPSSTNNVFLFPAPDQNKNPFTNHSNNICGKISHTPHTPTIQNITSQSTPPSAQGQSTPGVLRQASQSDSETAKPPSSPSSLKLQRHRSARKSAKPVSPVETRKLNGDASSSSGPDSPSKPGRRRASVYFKRNGSTRRTTSVDQTDGTAGEMTTTCSERERSNSDVSSRTSGGCRRKLSSTGRDNAKVPWCGCWGNGCL